MKRRNYRENDIIGEEVEIIIFCPHLHIMNGVDMSLLKKQ